MLNSSSNLKKSVGEYFLDEPLFIDSYTETYRGFSTKTSQEVLIRNIQLSTLSIIEGGYKLLADEISALRNYNNPNICKLLTFFQTKNNYYLIYDTTAEGSLESYLRTKQFIPESEAVKFLQDILHGYADIYKTKNYLKSIRLDSFIISHKTLKFFDLGLIKNFEKFKTGSQIKTNYKFFLSLAPEIYYGQAQNNTCDIWSIGIIFYQMLFGDLPWRSDNINEFFKAALTQPINLINKHQTLSKVVQDALVKMLNPDINKRITFEDLLKDPLFTNYIDNLREREQKLVEKIKKKPDSWQAASMLYTEDPLLSIFNLSISVQKSTSKKSHIPKVEGLLSKMNKSIQKIDKSSPNLQHQVLGLDCPNQQTSHCYPSLDQPIFNKSQVNQFTQNQSVNKGINQSIKVNNTSSEGGDTLEDLERSLEELVKGSVRKPHNDMQMQIEGMSASTKKMANKIQKADLQEEQAQNNRIKGIIQNAQEQIQREEQNKQGNLTDEFRKYNLRINQLCEYFQLYSHAASSATKLFKTDMIIFQCFFLYKRLLKSLAVIYEALATGDNIFNFKYWDEYQNSVYFIKIADMLESHFERVEDVFDKILEDCRRKLKNPQLRIEGMEQYISEDIDNIENPFNSFLIPYLEKFLPSEEVISDKGRLVQIVKHKIEIVNSLLLNKMNEGKPEEAIVDIKEHKEILRKEDLNSLNRYFQEQYKKLDLFKLNTLKSL